MSIETSHITISGLRVSIVRKAIKNLHLGVYPPNGRVRVAAPLTVTDDAVRLAVIGKLGWIKRQQSKFKAQPRQSIREMVSGETHYFLGRRYRLRVIEKHAKPAAVVLRNRTIIELQTPSETTAEQRGRVLQRWYRAQLRELIPPLLEKWESRLGVEALDWGIKKMKTKWGACNAEARRIWLNLELAKKPVRCIEYIIVHELAHIIERHHNDRFISIMDNHLQQWRLIQQELNQTPLAPENWGD